MAKPLKLEPFRSLVHTGFDLGDFRSVFIKAAWKSYNEQTAQSVASQRFQVLAGDFFDALFAGKQKELIPLLEELRNLFTDISHFEPFLTDTFYIVLNYYIKSFYGTLNGWEKIIHFTTGIEQFIAYAAGHLGDEALFLFEDTLIDALERLRQRHEPIMVLNTYYGVPIQYPAQVVHTDAHSITIKLHPIQETAALLQNGIYLLHNNQLSSDVFASVNPVIIDGERVLELTRFDQLETSLHHRQSVRVQPGISYSVNIVHASLNLYCRLYDISIGGIALTSKHFYSIPVHSETALIFPDDMVMNVGEVKGYLVFMSSYEGGYKYHFKIQPTLQQEGELSKYIARREQEIVKQLREEIV